MSDEPDRKPAADTDENRIAWHPAFFEAIQLELAQYKDVLEFIAKHQLSAEPQAGVKQRLTVLRARFC